jgi:hypothetical protein
VTRYPMGRHVWGRPRRTARHNELTSAHSYAETPIALYDLDRRATPGVTMRARRYADIDLRIQQLRIALQSLQPGWDWELTPNWAEVAAGKATTVRITGKNVARRGRYAVQIPLITLLDEPISSTAGWVITHIDTMGSR